MTILELGNLFLMPVLVLQQYCHGKADKQNFLKRFKSKLMLKNSTVGFICGKKRGEKVFLLDYVLKLGKTQLK